MNRLLRIHARARGDIDKIFRWLAQRSPFGARSWYDALFVELHRVADRPESFVSLFEATPRWQRDIRQTLFKTRRGRRYRIIFELTLTEVRVLRVRGPGQPPIQRRDLPRR